MCRLFRLVFVASSQISCGVLPVAACGSWLYLSFESARAYFEYAKSILVVGSAARTAFMMVPLKRSAKLLSSWLWGTIRTCATSILPRISSTTLLLYSPTLSLMNHFSARSKDSVTLSRNGVRNSGVRDLTSSGATYDNLDLTSIKDMKYLSTALDKPGMFRVPLYRCWSLLPSHSYGTSYYFLWTSAWFWSRLGTSSRVSFSLSQLVLLFVLLGSLLTWSVFRVERDFLPLILGEFFFRTISFPCYVKHLIPFVCQCFRKSIGSRSESALTMEKVIGFLMGLRWDFRWASLMECCKLSLG